MVSFVYLLVSHQIIWFKLLIVDWELIRILEVNTKHTYEFDAIKMIHIKWRFTLNNIIISFSWQVFITRTSFGSYLEKWNRISSFPFSQAVTSIGIMIHFFSGTCLNYDSNKTHMRKNNWLLISSIDNFCHSTKYQIPLFQFYWKLV